jgi:phosphohistidine phosphatase SixA
MTRSLIASRRRFFKVIASTAIVFSGLVTVAFSQGEPAQYLSDKELLENVQHGGCIIFLRHPKTNPDQADTDPWHLENVAAQRQLSEEGRQTAQDLGLAFRKLKIPISKVIASKFNRAAETGKLLDVGEVETSSDVAEGGLVVSPNENQRRTKALRVLLSTPPPSGKNIVIVSHRPNLQDAAGKEFGDAAEGEAVVFQPQANGGFKCLGRVLPAKWTEWAK